ncbi:hypothetical protein KGF56_002902 [Candida oxycetoniae]|uniref:Nitrogen regulatory protein areA GATA-like domain-containing protein n=1 Tax=Candida oxycetoniae TaxID=497107 RepID=A0AAI9SW89_9ASCO|nr:uncharacterized protein KGF56_002902 [Candida oxycetoniae]KAI3404263.1 hypothetical protein KGF56_002902 [Candida oxycetoniae]
MLHFLDDMILGSSFYTSYINTKFDQNIDYLEYVPQISSSTTEHYLQDNSNLINFIKYINSDPDYKYGNQFLYTRLQNICWRRIFKNHKNLPDLNPLIINWDKNSDITWLFGPRVELDLPAVATSAASSLAKSSKQEGKTFITTKSQNQYSLQQHIPIQKSVKANNEDEDEDKISVSSYDSDSSMDSQYSQDFIHTSAASLPIRKDSSCSITSSYFEEEVEDDEEKQPVDEITVPAVKSILKKQSTNISDDGGAIKSKKEQKKVVSFNYIINTREIIDNISLDYNFLDKNCI